MEIIVSEDFELTESIKKEIHDKVERINELLNKESTVKVFLSKDSSKQYHVKMSGHIYKHDVVSDATDLDFHACLNSAKAKFLLETKYSKKVER